jgi:hypothetical protein
VEEGIKRKVSVPIPENMDLGLDKRGNVLNNSNRKSHCFGVGKNAIFPKERVDLTRKRKDGILRGRGGSTNSLYRTDRKFWWEAMATSRGWSWISRASTLW